MFNRILGALEALVGVVVLGYALLHNSTTETSQAAGILAGILMLVFGIALVRNHWPSQRQTERQH